MASASDKRQGLSPWALLLSATPIRRRHIVVLAVLSIVSNLLMLVGPIFMLQVYDRVLGSRSVPTLVALTALMIVLFVFYGVIEAVRSRITVRVSMMIQAELGSDAFKSAVLAGTGPGSSDPVRDLDLVRGFVAGPGPVSLLDLPWLPIYMGLVIALHPLLGIVASVGALIMVALLIANEVLSVAPGQQANAAISERNSFTEDAKSNRDVIVAMGMMPTMSERFSAMADMLTESQRRSSDQAAFFASAGKSFRLLFQSTVLAAGAYLVILGQLSPGLMLASSVITARALAPIEMLIGQWKGFVAARQALGRLSTRLARPAVGARPRTALPRPSKSLSVSGLASGPTPQQPLVAEVAFSLSAGEGLGIIGPSGSGKSTVARAITGIWPSLRGEVRYDGTLLGHYDSEVLGAAIGYLPQEVELFDGTIAENICRFRMPSTSAPILAAAAASGTHQLISNFVDGYDTRIGPRGTALSAGQRQRIGLARAIYGDPFVLVLDEPNSNLDQDGEQALIETLRVAKARGAIVIIVAHRPSAIAATEKLLFMNGGRQLAFGDRDEVLRRVTKQPVPISVAQGARS